MTAATNVPRPGGYHTEYTTGVADHGNGNQGGGLDHTRYNHSPLSSLSHNGRSTAANLSPTLGSGSASTAAQPSHSSYEHKPVHTNYPGGFGYGATSLQGASPRPAAHFPNSSGGGGIASSSSSYISSTVVLQHPSIVSPYPTPLPTFSGSTSSTTYDSNPVPFQFPLLGRVRCYWCILSPNLDIIFCDPIFDTHLGEERQKFIGSNLQDYIHPDELERIRADLMPGGTVTSGDHDRHGSFGGSLSGASSSGRSSLPGSVGSGVEAGGVFGSVTRCRFARMARIRKSLGNPHPPKSLDAEMYTLNEDYLEIRITTSWICGSTSATTSPPNSAINHVGNSGAIVAGGSNTVTATKGAMLAFFHALEDKDPSLDSDEQRKTHWSNWCGPQLQPGFEGSYMNPKRCEQLMEALEKVTTSSPGNAVDNPIQTSPHPYAMSSNPPFSSSSLPPFLSDSDSLSIGPPLHVFQILDHLGQVILSFPAPPTPEKGGKEYDVEEYANLAREVLARPRRASDATTSCTRRYRSKHPVMGAGTLISIESVVILYGAITFACFQTGGVYLSSSRKNFNHASAAADHYSPLRHTQNAGFFQLEDVPAKDNELRNSTTTKRGRDIDSMGVYGGRGLGLGVRMVESQAATDSSGAIDDISGIPGSFSKRPRNVINTSMALTGNRHHSQWNSPDHVLTNSQANSPQQQWNRSQSRSPNPISQLFQHPSEMYKSDVDLNPPILPPTSASASTRIGEPSRRFAPLLESEKGNTSSGLLSPTVASASAILGSFSAHQHNHSFNVGAASTGSPASNNGEILAQRSPNPYAQQFQNPQNSQYYQSHHQYPRSPPSSTWHPPHSQVESGYAFPPPPSSALHQSHKGATDAQSRHQLKSPLSPWSSSNGTGSQHPEDLKQSFRPSSTPTLPRHDSEDGHESVSSAPITGTAGTNRVGTPSGRKNDGRLDLSSDSSKEKDPSMKIGAKACESCGTINSPEWRKGPSGTKSLCNACGLRYARAMARKSKLARAALVNSAKDSDSGSEPVGAKLAGPEPVPKKRSYQKSTFKKLAKTESEAGLSNEVDHKSSNGESGQLNVAPANSTSTTDSVLSKFVSDVQSAASNASSREAQLARPYSIYGTQLPPSQRSGLYYQQNSQHQHQHHNHHEHHQQVYPSMHQAHGEAVGRFDQHPPGGENSPYRLEGHGLHASAAPGPASLVASLPAYLNHRHSNNSHWYGGDVADQPNPSLPVSQHASPSLPAESPLRSIQRRENYSKDHDGRVQQDKSYQHPYSQGPHLSQNHHDYYAHHPHHDHQHHPPQHHPHHYQGHTY